MLISHPGRKKNRCLGFSFLETLIFLLALLFLSCTFLEVVTNTMKGNEKMQSRAVYILEKQNATN